MELHLVQLFIISLEVHFFLLSRKISPLIKMQAKTYSGLFVSVKFVSLIKYCVSVPLQARGAQRVPGS